MLSYLCVFLRTYFPVEFITAYLNNPKNIDDVVNGTDLAENLDISYLNELEYVQRKLEILETLSNDKQTISNQKAPNKINIYNVEFGKSAGKYAPDAQNYSIYKGVGSIKGLNSKIADELLEISKKPAYQNIDKLSEGQRYVLFYDLIKDIEKNTSVQKNHILTLIKLNYFKAFGGNFTLNEIFNNVQIITSKKQYNKKDIEFIDIDFEIFKNYIGTETAAVYKDIDYDGYYHERLLKCKYKEFPIRKQLQFEKDLLGNYIYRSEDKKSTYVILKIDVYGQANKPYFNAYNLSNGEVIRGKITKGEYYSLNKFQENSIITDVKFKQQNKKKKLPDGTMIETDDLICVFNSWKILAP